jgi:hypothetical protein
VVGLYRVVRPLADALGMRTEQLHSLAPPLLTSGLFWLKQIGSSGPAPRQSANAALGPFRVIRILPIGEEATVWMMSFLRRYQKLRPPLADACLVYLAEQEDLETVFTLDRKKMTRARRLRKTIYVGFKTA